MRNSAIATSAILFLSCVAIIADMTKQGYMEFTSAADIKKALPNITPQEFAKVIEGNSKGCLTKPSQTKPVTIAQIKTLRQLTDPQSISVLLGNAYCETDKGFRWITESGKQLDIDKALDYEFSSSESNTLTNIKKRTSKETNGSANRSLQPRVSTPSTLTTREAVKNQ